jgi:hypothetical protein
MRERRGKIVVVVDEHTVADPERVPLKLQHQRSASRLGTA